MFRKAGLLFCANEHGVGDVTFPSLSEMVEQEILDFFITPATEAQTRRKAKAAGWGRVNGEDYCPGCLESM